MALILLTGDQMTVTSLTVASLIARTTDDGDAMNQPVPADIIRATILAGTVASAGGAPSELPPAYSPSTPEPAWAERDLRALAPAEPIAAPPPLPTSPVGLAARFRRRRPAGRPIMPVSRTRLRCWTR